MLRDEPIISSQSLGLLFILSEILVDVHGYFTFTFFRRFRATLTYLTDIVEFSLVLQELSCVALVLSASCSSPLLLFVLPLFLSRLNVSSALRGLDFDLLHFNIHTRNRRTTLRLHDLSTFLWIPPQLLQFVDLPLKTVEINFLVDFLSRKERAQLLSFLFKIIT